MHFNGKVINKCFNYVSDYFIEHLANANYRLKLHLKRLLVYLPMSHKIMPLNEYCLMLQKKCFKFAMDGLVCIETEINDDVLLI